MIWLGGGYFLALCCHSLPQRSTGIGWAIQNEKREAQPMAHVWSRIKFDLPQIFHHLHLCGRWIFGVNWRKVSQQNRPVWLTTFHSASCLKSHRETHVKAISVNLKFRIVLLIPIPNKVLKFFWSVVCVFPIFRLGLLPLLDVGMHILAFFLDMACHPHGIGSCWVEAAHWWFHGALCSSTPEIFQTKYSRKPWKSTGRIWNPHRVRSKQIYIYIYIFR